MFKGKGGIAFTVFLILLCLALTSANPAGAATFVVNDINDVVDVNPGDGVCETVATNGICTLRAAVMEANALAGNDDITLPAGTYVLTIHNWENVGISGDLDITSTDTLTINGAGSATTIIDGDGDNSSFDRVFDILSGATAVINNVTIRNGYKRNGYVGGGIRNMGTLTLEMCVVSSNVARYGGGIYNGSSATLTVQDTTIETNDATEGAAGFGGGIYNSDGTVSVTGSLIYNNTAYNDGGGVYNTGGTVTLTNTTISSNTTTQAGSGGGIYETSPDTCNLYNVTISENIPDGIYNSGGTVNARNSIIAGNNSVDCAGPTAITSLDYNIAGDASALQV